MRNLCKSHRDFLPAVCLLMRAAKSWNYSSRFYPLPFCVQPASGYTMPQTVFPKPPARKKLSLVDPTTGKAIDLGGGVHPST